VLIDRQRFAVGQPVVGQMDATQDQADKHLLILSPEYLNSRYAGAVDAALVAGAGVISVALYQSVTPPSPLQP
jgi:hypothetical protein